MAVSKIWTKDDTYECSDFNRIESTIEKANIQLRKSLEIPQNLETVTDRTIESIIVVDDVNRIENNLEALGLYLSV